MLSKIKIPFFSDHKSFALTISILLHLIILFLLIFYADFSRPGIPPGYQGILVNFGMPITYEGQEQTENAEAVTQEQQKEQNESVSTELSEDDSPVLVNKNADKPVRQQEKTTKTSLQKPAEDFSRLFKNNSGAKSDVNQGDPLGSPGADALRGISKGEGKVGGGLEGRGVMYKPEIIEHSQKSGKVVVQVCIDSKGKVISAKFTQKGSTTTDADLVETAEFAATRYVFAPGEFEKECGTISIQFIVR
ncbi:MAG TPA: hypothetical protein DCX89_07055 [Saprospirales bacterium]|nr:hypothetical protein [Saprospirales bacterium]HAY71633.1 hypothetical protein [Saprospirales bacterium]HRQ30404.1 hypothetical protein [Saprospiraceae bacterium]